MTTEAAPETKTGRRFTALFVACQIAPCACWSQPVIIPIGQTGSSAVCTPTCISGDGSVVYGYVNTTPATDFQWTATSGLRTFPSMFSIKAISDDGSTIAGDGSGGAYRWDAINGVQFLGTLSCNAPAIVTGTSADGSVIVGYSQAVRPDSSCRIEPFYWTQSSGMFSLGVPFEDGVRPEGALALGVSGDGTRVVEQLGWGWPNYRDAVYWTGEPLTLIGYPNTHAEGISLDGQVIYGYSSVSNTSVGFRRQNGVNIYMSFGLTYSNFDGSALIGSGGHLWTAVMGEAYLPAYLASIGLDLSGWQLLTMTGMSSDGTAFMGTGRKDGSSTGFLIKLPCPVGTALSLSPVDGTTTCRSGSASFSVAASGVKPYTFSWQIEDATASGVWIDLVDGLLIRGTHQIAEVSGSQTKDLLYAVLFDDGLPVRVRAVVANSCASVTSNPAVLTICATDFDCDDFVSGDDFDQFVSAFESGLPAADFNADGFISGDDFDLFVAAFEAGC